MPWTPQEFRDRHNRKLSLGQADKARKQAEAMMRSGVPEGEAIATANKHAETMTGHRAKTRSDLIRSARRKNG